jgi:hypothetical protein
MKRQFVTALLLVIGVVGSAAADHGYYPVQYPDPPGSFEHGQAPVRPVYQQPLAVPIEDELLDGPVAGDGCAECASGACSIHDHVRPWDMWVRMEYLIWWAEGNQLPPLVTTATGTGTGILGAADTQILFGNSRADREDRGGGRFTLGAWLDDEHCTAAEANAFVLEDSSTGFEITSEGSPLIARPFFNVLLQSNAVQTLASPGVSTGGVFVSTTSEVHGAELMLRRRIDNCCDRRVDLIYGYRYAGLDESILIRDELTSTDPTSNIPVGTVVGGFDSFETFNQFHGGELGLAMDIYRRRWTLGLIGKVALGNMREQVTIGGSTFVAVPGVDPNVTPGGLLTQPSNLGGFSRDEFVVVPEFQLNLRYCLTRNLEFSVGYTFIYFSDAVRPADQIDLRVDPRQITDPANSTPFPALEFVGNDFWIQGLNLGLEYKF